VVTHVILPDDIPSFPRIAGNWNWALRPVNQAGNESDLTKISAYFDFTVPEAPKSLVGRRPVGPAPIKVFEAVNQTFRETPALGAERRTCPRTRLSVPVDYLASGRVYRDYVRDVSLGRASIGCRDSSFPVSRFHCLSSGHS